MQRGLIEATCLWITGTESQVNGSSHLFVEENVPGVAGDAHIVTEGELTQVTCTRIKFQHLLKVLLPTSCTCLNDLALTEDEADALDGTPIVGGGNIELD